MNFIGLMKIQHQGVRSSNENAVDRLKISKESRAMVFETNVDHVCTIISPRESDLSFCKVMSLLGSRTDALGGRVWGQTYQQEGSDKDLG